MDIEILNEQYVISDCERLLTSYLPNMGDTISSLESLITKINNQWQSTGLDKESYVLEIDKQTKNLAILKNNIRTIATTLLAYAQNIEKINSNSVNNINAGNVTIGGNLGTNNIKVGYDSAYQAVTGKGGETLNPKYVNENSKLKSFAVVNDNGTVSKIESSNGTNLNDYVQKNNYDVGDIAIDVADGQGESSAWIPATDLVNKP